MKRESVAAPKRVQDYLEFGALSTQRAVEQLEGGPGFIVAGDNIPAAAINTLYPAKFIALLEFLESEPRGNHYHHKKEEVILILMGEVLCEFRLPESKQIQVSHTLTAGEYVRITPGCVHIFTAVNGTAIAMEYGSTSYDDEDVIKV